MKLRTFGGTNKPLWLFKSNCFNETEACAALPIALNRVVTAKSTEAVPQHILHRYVCIVSIARMKNKCQSKNTHFALHTNEHTQRKRRLVLFNYFIRIPYERYEILYTLAAVSVNGYYEWVKIWTCEADQTDRLTHSDDRLLDFAWICVCEWLTN